MNADATKPYVIGLDLEEEPTQCSGIVDEAG